MFSAPNKLSRVCPAIEKKENAENPRRNRCQVDHNVPSLVQCLLGVVYCLPLSCGSVYVGQIGRCFNTRLREHRNKLKTYKGAHLYTRCGKCKCNQCFEDTEVLYQHKDRPNREVVEAFHFAKNSRCISKPSIRLAHRELDFLARAV